MSIVEQNLRRAKRQSDKIVFDTYRIKGLPDRAVEREIRAKLKFIDGISEVKLITKRRQIIDIVKDV